MTFDYRAAQLRTSKIIASGSTGTNAQLLFYPIAADGTPANQGNINPVTFGTGSIGQDVWFFVSGALGGLDGTSPKVAAFGGDVHISGNLRVGTVLFSTLSSSLYGLSSSYTALSAAFVSVSSSYETLSSSYTDISTSYIALSQSLTGSGGAAINAAKGAVRTVLVGDDETTAFFQYNSESKTLTFQGNANLNDFSIGGITDFTSDDRVLFSIPANAACFTASGSWSGIYSITNVGANDPSGSAPVLTRATDFDTTSDVTPGSFVFANSGNPDTEAPEIWYLATSGSVTLDTTPLLFASASFSLTGSGGATYTGSDTIEINANVISVKTGSIGPSHLSGTVADSTGGLQVNPIMGIRINVDGTTIQITNNTLTLSSGSVGPTQLSSSVAGNGLTFASNLEVLADPVLHNPLVVSVDGTSVRAASPAQSGYITKESFAQLEAVVSYSAIPATAGGIANAVTTSNTETAAFNIGTVPADTIWTVKFTTFSVDTVDPVNLVNQVGAFAFYRSGSNNVVQIGNTEIEHAFVSGAFTSITASVNLAMGDPGNLDMTLQGINTYNIKHWAKFQVTEFTYI